MAARNPWAQGPALRGAGCEIPAAMSAPVRRLERELGQDLLDRWGRTVRLTEAGAAVLRHARAALAAAAAARLAVSPAGALIRRACPVWGEASADA